MLAKERQQKISNLLKREAAVSVTDLAKTYNVSIETIRKDLLFMEKNGLLVRVHGGALPVGDMTSFERFSVRVETHTSEKSELARKAAEFVQENDIIALDSGSTTVAFAEVLKQKFTKLTVVTHDKYVFDILCNHADFEVILCGGHYMKSENAFYGELTANMYEQLHVQKVFLCPSALSLEGGISDFQKDLYSIQKKMLSCGERIFVLADSSKFEKKGLLKVSDMRKDFVYITDDALSDALYKAYQENDIQIHKGAK